MLAQDSGNAILVAPPVLLPGNTQRLTGVTLVPSYGKFGNPSSVVGESTVSIPHRLGSGILEVLTAEVTSTTSNRLGVPVFEVSLTSEGRLISRGDSGGGLWFDGEVVGNTWFRLVLNGTVLQDVISARLPTRFWR